ncbi:MAG: 16S rRNA (guanine(527)-N(7))-methyltransferase RsmG [Deltaproteobacteria bacterium]|nr:16S rRNA (guanine(527)-N(7))-methyltransferase RsmG [Deltaproteobacteria bacterium]
MIRLFRESGLNLSDQAYHQFWTFHQHIRERNDECDLTRIRRFEDIVLKHYVDCALVPTLIELPSPLLDIGTGAGFPGLPIKIVSPHIQLVLAEGRNKRVEFLHETCKLLDLTGVDIYPHKIGPKLDLADLDVKIKGVITRALESIDKTLLRITSFLPQGAQAIFMKGPSCQPEIDKALDLMGQEYELSEDISYSIPNSPHQRRLVVFTRTSAPSRVFYSSEEKSDTSVLLMERPNLHVKNIHSRSNPSFKTFLHILSGRGVKKRGLALISGPKQVTEILEEFAPSCTGWLTHDKGEPPPVEAPLDLIWYRMSKELFGQIDIYGTGRPLLLVKVPSIGEWTDTNRSPGCTLFIPFQDPANVGAVIRTAAAFGVTQVVLLKEAANPFHHKSVRAAGSTLFRIPLLRGPSIKDLQSEKVPLFGLSPRGRNIADFHFPPSFGLIPGLEGPGLPEGSFGELLSIPMEGGIESLNAATATGIVLYLWRAGCAAR